MKYDVAIIGAGPAGMMAAITASEKGKRVALVDKNTQPGRKLLATGNGRCNLTNVITSIERYHGSDPTFIATVLRRFEPSETLEFFGGLGLALKEEDNGRIFPRTNQASSVLSVLMRRLARNAVDLLLETNVSAIERKARWEITLSRGDRLQADKLILATGGKSAPNLGSTGDGWFWAKRFGHSLTAYYPALVPMETVETWPKEAQGIRVDARVLSTCEGNTLRESSGDVLFTSYGVSGPAVMAHAGGIAPLIKEHKVELHIDLFPDMPSEVLTAQLQAIMLNPDVKTVSEALVGLLPSGLIPVVIRLAGLTELMPVSKVTEARRMNLVGTLKGVVVTVAGLRPYKEAQVTAGGLNSAEIDADTLQSRLAPGLYFAGEMLDCDGDSGGFNLQWAWASGYVAGQLGG